MKGERIKEIEREKKNNKILILKSDLNIGEINEFCFFVSEFPRDTLIS